jgi:pSer/pThr/pTyr-binding forkhead associated (FHA) protein
MNAMRYFSIGSDPQNDLQLPATDCAPFHLLLGQDQAKNVLIASRAAGAGYLLNGQLVTQTSYLQAGDELRVGSNVVDWMRVFDISSVEMSVGEEQQKSTSEKHNGLRFQLIFIYLAIALLIFLIAFYI